MTTQYSIRERLYGLTDSTKKMGIELEFNGKSREAIDQAIDTIREQGVKIGLERYNHTTKDYWKLITDASLNASRGEESFMLELVSPPLNSNEMGLQLMKITNVFNLMGFSVNSSCGFHIHHEAPRFSPKRLKYLVNHFVKNEANFDSIVSPSRRNSRWASSNKSRLKSSVDSQGVSDTLSRYHKLNLQSYPKYGTIEFRQHQGTLDFEKIVNWAIFTQALVTRSYRKVTETEGYDNPMHNYILASGWGTENQGAIYPKTEHNQDFLIWLKARMEHFGVQDSFKLTMRNFA